MKKLILGAILFTFSVMSFAQMNQRQVYAQNRPIYFVTNLDSIPTKTYPISKVGVKLERPISITRTKYGGYFMDYGSSTMELRPLNKAKHLYRWYINDKQMASTIEAIPSGKKLKFTII